MSRPIEFRFWHKANEEMFNDMQALDGQDINDIFLDEDFVFMQYTGLTDKNGKKVFEGDIICQNDSSKKRYSVVEFCSHLKSASRDSPSTFNTGYYACTQGGYKLGFQEGFTVEGNVYENPELLNVNSNT